MILVNPPSTTIKIEAQKAAFDNGYRIEHGVQKGWLHYRSSSVPGEIAIGGESDSGPWHLKVSYDPVVREFGSDSFTFNSLGELYSTLDRVYRLSVSLPDAPLKVFEEQIANLPQTTEVERSVVQRVGQNVFRDALLSYWDGCCPLTGISDTSLLRASHIVPWSECDSNAHRLNVHNGILLSALWDLAFDSGLISFSDDGHALFSNLLSEKALHALKSSDCLKIESFTTEHQMNLQRHREKYGFNR